MADGSRATVAVPIHPPGAPPADVGAIVAALDGQPSVAEVEHDAERGTLVIHYDDRRGAARVLAGIVRDRIRAARRLPPSVERRVEVTIAHQLPGRVRLKIGGGVAGAPEQIAALLGQIPGVERAR